MFLYYITDRKQLSIDPTDSIHLLLQRIRMAAEAGIDAIQLREKDLSARQMGEVALRAMEIVSTANANRAPQPRTRLLINSHIDVALACGCDGVHLRSDDISTADARAVFLHSRVAHPFIGVSCHTLREIELAAGHGADFVVFGPVFGKSGTRAPAGIDNLAKACQLAGRGQSRMRVLALGAITFDNAAACLRAGASGLAGIRIFQTGNMHESIARLRSLHSRSSIDSKATDLES